MCPGLLFSLGQYHAVLHCVILLSYFDLFHMETKTLGTECRCVSCWLLHIYGNKMIIFPFFFFLINLQSNYLTTS